jgi:peptide/nickel transport system substrate-binding protein
MARFRERVLLVAQWEEGKMTGSRKLLVTSATVLLVLSLVLSACGGTATPKATTAAPTSAPSTLVWAMDMGDLLTFDPQIASELSAEPILDQIYECLVQRNPESLSTLSPMLADKWEVSGDGLTFTFSLHPGIKFVSGNPFTAEDVRFTYIRMKNMKGPNTTVVDPISTITVVDPMTVKITLSSVNVAFLSWLTQPAMQIMDSVALKQHGGTDAADADKTDTAKAYLDQNSCGTGPFTLTSWTSKAQVVMVANPNYWGTKPKLSKMVVQYVADPSTALQMLQKGDIDLIYKVDADLAARVKADSSLTLVAGQKFDMEYVAMTANADISKPLSDKRVRQAVIAAIDYDGLLKAAYKGYAGRGPSIVPLGILGADPALIQNRDLAKAKQLLKDAGYGDGVTIDLSYGTDTTRGLEAEKIKSDLAEAGITVNLKPLEMTVYFELARGQKLAMLIGPWGSSSLDPSDYSDWFTYPDAGVAKRMWYNNPESVRLAKAISAATDTAKREQLVKDLIKVWEDDANWTMLAMPQHLVAMSNKIKGFVFHPLALARFQYVSK